MIYNQHKTTIYIVYVVKALYEVLKMLSSTLFFYLSLKYNSAFLSYDLCLWCILILEENFMLEQQNEAFYHFTLSAMVDLIDEYGYCNVINDLDDMIADRISLKLAEVTAV